MGWTAELNGWTFAAFKQGDAERWAALGSTVSSAICVLANDPAQPVGLSPRARPHIADAPLDFRIPLTHCETWFETNTQPSGVDVLEDHATHTERNPHKHQHIEHGKDQVLVTHQTRTQAI